MNDSVLISRVVLKNYKSVAACSVPFTECISLEEAASVPSFARLMRMTRARSTS